MGTVDELNKISAILIPFIHCSSTAVACPNNGRRLSLSPPPRNSATALSTLLAHCRPVDGPLVVIFVSTSKLVTSALAPLPVPFLVVDIGRFKVRAEASKKSILVCSQFFSVTANHQHLNGNRPGEWVVAEHRSALDLCLHGHDARTLHSRVQDFV